MNAAIKDRRTNNTQLPERRTRPRLIKSVLNEDSVKLICNGCVIAFFKFGCGANYILDTAGMGSTAKLELRGFLLRIGFAMHSDTRVGLSDWRERRVGVHDRRSYENHNRRVTMHPMGGYWEVRYGSDPHYILGSLKTDHGITKLVTCNANYPISQYGMKEIGGIIRRLDA